MCSLIIVDLRQDLKTREEKLAEERNELNSFMSELETYKSLYEENQDLQRMCDKLEIDKQVQSLSIRNLIFL